MKLITCNQNALPLGRSNCLTGLLPLQIFSNWLASSFWHPTVCRLPESAPSLGGSTYATAV